MTDIDDPSFSGGVSPEGVGPQPLEVMPPAPDQSTGIPVVPPSPALPGAAEPTALTALVYRASAHQVVAVDVWGDPPELEPFASVWHGGEWEDVQVLYEQEPPAPPAEVGLWLMRWPWRRLTAAELIEEPELCCRYEGEPEWTRIERDALTSRATAVNAEPSAEQIERGARAMWDFDLTSKGDLTWESDSEKVRATYRSLAGIALRAAGGK